MFHYNASWRDKGTQSKMNPIRKHSENGKHSEPSMPSKKETSTKIETDISNEQCESNTLTTSTDVESVHIQQPINLMDRQDCRLLAVALSKSEAQRSKLQRKLIRSQSKVKAMKLEFQKTTDIKEQYESLKETMVELQELLSQQVKAQEASDEITQSLREELETITTKYANLEADYMTLHESKSLYPQTPNVSLTPKAPKLQMITNSNHELVQKQNRQLKGANRKMKEQIGKLVDEMIVLRQKEEKRDQEIQESNTSEIARQNLEYGKQIAKLRASKYNEKKKYAKTLDELREEIAIMKEEKKVLVAGQNQVEIAHLRAETAQLSRSLAHVRVAKSSLEQKVAKLSELMTLDAERVFN